MTEHQHNASSGPYTDIYSPYGIGEAIFPDTQLRREGPPLVTFCAPPHLLGEYRSALLSPPEDEGILASTHLYFDSLVNGSVPELNTIPLDYWSASSFAGFAEFTAEPVAVPSMPKLDAPNEPGPTPKRPSRPPTAKKPRAKRKNDTYERLPRKSSKRKSSRDGQTNMQIDGNRENPNHGNDGNARGGDNLAKRQRNENTERTHDNSLIASHTYRVKKKQALQRLRLDERNSEQAISDLTHHVTNLTREVHELKMQLLQHTDCNCTLIQRYIAHEAQQYIESIERSQDSEGLDIAGP